MNLKNELSFRRENDYNRCLIVTRLHAGPRFKIDDETDVLLMRQRDRSKVVELLARSSF